MVAGEHRRTRMIVDTEAIKFNVQQVKNQLGKNIALYAVVKANGYGHGAVEVAMAAKEAGANGFCVAILDEALELREAGFTETILIMGITDARYAHLLQTHRLSQAVSDVQWMKEAERNLEGKACDSTLAVHLALDTGMGRIGLKTAEDVQQAEKILQKSNHLFFEGVFTHFATADEPDTTLFEQQQKKFQSLIGELHALPPYIHNANSATALWHKDSSFNMVRFGIAMYGLNPSGGVIKEPFLLKPAMRLVSEVVHVKQMRAGETISYGATYKAKEGEWIGTLPIGYADGWRRKLQGQEVLVEGIRCEIVGRICMDQCMIRLPYEVPVGTEVVLIGQDGPHEVRVEEVSEKMDTNNYEVVCSFTERIPRVYL